MSEILYKSEKGYNIREGVKYYVIIKNRSKYKSEALVAGDDEPKGVTERWLIDPSKRVDELNGKITAQAPKQSKVDKSTKKYNSIYDQIIDIESQKDFDRLLVDYKYTILVTKDSGSVKIALNGNKELFSVSHGTKGNGYCCGGRENGGHSGFIDSNFLRDNQIDCLYKLAPYFAKYYDDKISTDESYFTGYFHVAYCKLNSFYSRFWGELLSNSKYYEKVGNFKNRNTKNELDVYVSSEEFTKLY